MFGDSSVYNKAEICPLSIGRTQPGSPAQSFCTAFYLHLPQVWPRQKLKSEDSPRVAWAPEGKHSGNLGTIPTRDVSPWCLELPWTLSNCVPHSSPLLGKQAFIEVILLFSVTVACVSAWRLFHFDLVSLPVEYHMRTAHGSGPRRWPWRTSLKGG